MPELLFVLGREPELSVAELSAFAHRQNISLAWREVTERFAVVAGEFPPQILQQLAGTVKLGEVVGTCPRSPRGVQQAVLAALRAAPEQRDCEFGFSSYGARLPWLLQAGMQVKRELKTSGKHVRLVTSRGAELSSVVVQKRKLLPPDGFEFVFVPQGRDELTVARTLEVQPFEAWSQRDYGRPARDARVGMLPPKLARLMVNLAEVPLGGALLDPFCGSGTVLQEAALAGYGTIVGADADARGIERTKQNLAWLSTKFPGAGGEPKLFVADIRALPSLLGGQKFDGIVTEPYLGPPLRGNEPAGTLRQIASELTDLYHTILRVLVRLVAPGGRIVMVWPSIKASETELTLPLLELLPKLGLAIVDILPPEAPHGWRSPRGTLRYERPDARVGREVVILQRT